MYRLCLLAFRSARLAKTVAAMALGSQADRTALSQSVDYRITHGTIEPVRWALHLARRTYRMVRWTYRLVRWELHMARQTYRLIHAATGENAYPVHVREFVDAYCKRYIFRIW